MSKIKTSIQSILLLSSVVALITCGGGNGGSVPTKEPEIKAGPITGKAALGPITSGTVTAYDFSSGAKGAIIETAAKKSDLNGVYSFNFKSKNKPILICISGGSYAEPASPRTVVTGGFLVPDVTISFTNNEELCAVANYQTGQSQ